MSNKNKAEEITYKMPLFYTMVVLILVIIPSHKKLNFLPPMSPTEKDTLIVVLGAALCLLHYALVTRKRDLTPYGKVFLHFYVIDWGPFGDSFELPEHLCTPFPHWTACSSRRVEETAKEIERKLTEADNDRYLRPEKKALRIEVRRKYFRVGANCNETGEEYLKAVIEELEQVRLDFFTFIESDEDIDPKWLLDHYLEPGYNGSLLV